MHKTGELNKHAQLCDHVTPPRDHLMSCVEGGDPLTGRATVTGEGVGSSTTRIRLRFYDSLNTSTEPENEVLVRPVIKPTIGVSLLRRFDQSLCTKPCFPNRTRNWKFMRIGKYVQIF